MERGGVVLRQSGVILAWKVFVLTILTNSMYFGFTLFNNLLDNFGLAKLYNSVLYDVGFFSIVIVVQLAFILYVLTNWRNEYYTVKDNKIVHRKGFFNQKEMRYDMDRIDSFDIEKGLMGKFFNYGTITFTNSFSKKEIFLEAIPYPEQFLKLFGDIPQNKKIQ